MKGKLGVRLGVLATLSALVIGVAGLSAVPASAHGCTPGFWNNKNGAPLAAPHDATVASVFTGFNTLAAGLKLSEALKLQGGAGIAGAQQILGRAAAAAYFNVQVGQDYPKSLPGLQTMVNDALATNDRATLISVAADIDFWNNAGNAAICP